VKSERSRVRGSPASVATRCSKARSFLPQLSRWILEYRLFACAGLAALLFLTGLGRPPLWEPDEGRYAEIAREMIALHDYITPHNNFIRYFEKPPLVYWLTAASLKVFGHSEFAVRFQAAITSLGEVLMTGALAEMMFGVVAGMLAAVTLALSPLFFAFARFATPDPALAFFFTAAMDCFYVGAQSLKAGGISSRWMHVSAAMLGLGTLTKGPVALLLGVAIALLWLTAQGRARDALGISWLGCAAIYLLITLPWFIVVAERNPGFLQFFIVHEHFQRYTESTEHGWGPWFFVAITVAGTWPWCYFAPLALSRAKLWPLSTLRHFGRTNRLAVPVKRKNRVADEHERAALRFLLIWFGVVFVFFSIPRSKLGEYILPGLPPLAILAGYGIAGIREIDDLERRRLLRIFAVVNGAVAIALTVGVLAGAGGALGRAVASYTLVASAALLAGGVTPLLAARRREVAIVVLPLALAVLVVMSVASVAREKIAAMVSYRDLAETIAPYAKDGCRLVSYRHFEQALPFYIGIRETLVNYRGELQPFGPRIDPNGIAFTTTSQLQALWASDQCTVLVANGTDLPRVVGFLAPAPTLIGCEGKKFALYNRLLNAPPKISPECLGAITMKLGNH
jgi:4-amino-4-deoxy-L-arabinose transferase-like glycosyltransferase